MKGLKAAAVGAIWLFILGGCVAQSEAPAVSAMPYVSDMRAQSNVQGVTVDLRELVTP